MTLRPTKRNSAIVFQVTTSNAIEFFDKLCELHERQKVLLGKINSRRTLSEEEKTEHQNIGLYQKALRVALVMEIRRMFDTYEKVAKKVISFEKVEFFSKYEEIKNEIDSIRGEAIIAEVISSSNTYFVHINEKIGDIISVERICSSSLKDLLHRLKKLSTTYTLWFTQNQKWDELV